MVGDVTILAKRSANVTFTEPYLGSGLSMLVRVKPDHKTFMLTKPFSRAVWVLIFATLIYTGIIIWYIEHERNPEFHGPWWTQLGATLWFMFTSVFFAHGDVVFLKTSIHFYFRIYRDIKVNSHFRRLREKKKSIK